MTWVGPTGAAIDWAATGAAEVAQCIRTLLATQPGDVPLSRSMGVPSVVDRPAPVAVATLQAAVVRAVRTYEPRVTVRRGRVTATADGRLGVAVEIVAP